MNYNRLISGQKYFIIILIWFGILRFAFGQGNFDTLLVQKIETFKQKYPAEVVFLHTDGDIYSPGEDIYFKAYTKDLYSSIPGTNSKNLQLLLIDPQGNVFLEKVFQVEESHSAGKIKLPTGIDEGKYILICLTGLMQNMEPENIFSKEIFIKKLSFNQIFVKLSVSDKVYLSSDKVRVTVNLQKFNGKPFKRKKFSYSVRTDNISFYSGTKKTDSDGKAVIEFIMPEFKKGSLISVKVTANYSKVDESNTVIIPTGKKPPDIEFFAEGGNLVEGLETKIGFTALDHSGKPLKIKGRIVDKNNKVVKDFRTLVDGLGYFKILPEADNKYKAIITEPPGIEIIYSLPKVLQDGINLTLTGQTNDVLSFKVNSNLQGSAIKIIAIAEMNGLITWEKQENLRDFVLFKVPVQGLPCGILRITLFNDNMEVLANRAVYLDRKGAGIEVETDRKEYIPGEEVNLKVSSENYSQQPVKTDMSISVIDNNISPDWNNDPDIFQWFLLGSAAGNSFLPQDIFNRKAEDAYRIIDCRMLALEKEKFNWKDVLHGKNSMQIIGKDKFISNVIEYYGLNESALLREIQNDQFFYKHILRNNMVFPEYLYVNRRFMKKNGITGQRVSRKEIIQRKLASGTPILNVIRSIKPFQLMGDKIVYHGVNSVVAQDGALFVVDGMKVGTSINILNSINPNNIANIEVFTNPVDVHKYTALNSVGVIVITSKRGLDEAEENKQITTYNSTLYWNPYLKILKNNEISVSFKSPKMKTKFRVVVQGVDEKGHPVFNESYFQVY